jgi:protein-S-isoprenylcysteine O-methyltransferase Ste14
MKRYLDLLLGWAKKQRSTLNKLGALCLGVTGFLFVIPTFFIWAGWQLPVWFSCNEPRCLIWIIAALTIPTGLFLLAWATITQWRIGKGTPNPMAPTQKLIINGPYRLCRNPIELGAILYWLGIVSLFASLVAGILAFLIGFLLGSSYHRFFEEQELAARFGKEYFEYKKEVPFLVPKFFSKRKK